MNRNSMPVKFQNTESDEGGVGLRTHEKEEIKKVQNNVANVKNSLAALPDIVDAKISMLESVSQFICEIRDTFDLYQKNITKMTKFHGDKKIVDLDSDDEPELAGEDMAEYFESLKKSDRLQQL